MSTWQKLGTNVAVTVTCLCWSLGHAEQLLFSCVNSKVSICNYVTCYMSHFARHMSHVTLRMSHVMCQMLMLILVTCWTTFVFMSMLKSEYLWLCHMSHFACHMSQCACHMSYVKCLCLCWFSRHAEQLLFSCLCSKVSIYSRKLQWFLFFDSHSTLSPDIGVSRAGSQLKKHWCQKKALTFTSINSDIWA